MEIMPITNLVMNDICKNKNDAYQVAFYDIHNFEIEKKISLNIEKDNCNKFRINDLNWLRQQELLTLPDVLIMRPTTKLTPKEQQLLVDLNIKIYYVSENILTDSQIFKATINDIERKIYKARTLKYFEIEKKQIKNIECRYANTSISNDELTNQLITELLNLIKNKDEVTYKHVTNVSSYVDIFLDGLSETEKLSEEEIIFLKRAALVHDIGKLTIPNQILKKRESLNDNEYQDMKKHVAENAYLFNSKLMADYKEIALCHHERYDGKGYPKGLKGEQIPYLARIISVIDAFEAMTGKREYVKKQKQKTLYEVLDILRKNAGTQFDPKVVNAFIIGVIKNPEFQISLSEKKGGILKCS